VWILDFRLKKKLFDDIINYDLQPKT